MIRRKIVRRGSAAGLGLAAVAALAGCNLGVAPVTYELVDDDQGNWPLGPSGLVTGDIDDDGDADAIVAGRYGYGLLDNDGSGAFTLEVEEPHVPHDSPSLADIDGDDDLDLVTTVPALSGPSQSWPAVNRNAGDGTFGAVEPVDDALPGGGELGTVAPSDVDGDGDTDLVAVVRTSNVREAAVYLNDGTGTFASPATYPLGYSYNVATRANLELGDLDGDGDEDLVLTDEGEVVEPDGETRRVTMAGAALNDGDGGFAASGPWFRAGPMGSYLALTPALADVDDDDTLDLALGGSMSITTWHGDGDGTFSAAKTSTLTDARDVEFVTPADVDDDGLVDLVAFERPGDPREGLVAYGDGAGNVAEYHEVGTGTSLGGDGTAAREVAVTDIDGDDDQDILFLAGSLGVVENATGGTRPAH